MIQDNLKEYGDPIEPEEVNWLKQIPTTRPVEA